MSTRNCTCAKSKLIRQGNGWACGNCNGRFPRSVTAGLDAIWNAGGIRTLDQLADLVSVRRIKPQPHAA